MSENNYLTDKELQLLIETAEQEPMPAAPGYLKETILAKAARTETRPRRELFFFGAKVIAAAAAAIALLLTMPDAEQLNRISQTELASRQKVADYDKEDSVLWQFNQKTNQFCSLLSDTANFIFYKEEN